MNALESFKHTLEQELDGVVVGMQEVIHALAIAVVARGHVLLQGAPGLGKTLLGKSLAAALGGVFRRVQGTADLMPSDITGVHVFDAQRQDFVFRPGPLFADVLLVDEINRSGPKTQSALLEAMEERQVSVDRQHYRLPANFLVIATQNPHEFEGTYPLPESQLDRFMLRVDLRYPTRASELAILARYGNVDAHAVPEPRAQSLSTALAAAQAAVEHVHVAEQLAEYVVDLAAASREHPQVSLGLSTRGVLALLRAARISAGMRGAQFVTPDDVKQLAPLVVAHRLVLTAEATLEGITLPAVIQQLLERTAVPR